MDASESKRTRLGRWALVLLTLLYGGAHLWWYWDTPLGQSPVLDERENLQLAAQIAQGSLSPEPFYRAMGYPLFLAGLRATGLLADDTPQAATAAGLLLHILNTLLVVRLAQKWFGTARAGLAAGLLHGLNPVLIHYATQILDGTLANTLFLIGLQFLPGRDEAGPPARSALCLSLAWTAAALVRPQFLLLWLALPLAWVVASGSWRAQLRPLIPALAAGGMLWLAQGFWSWRVSGEFRLLPWQGAYNLWAANKPGANGRYYTQTMWFEPPAGGAQENPARLESTLLYRQATGDNGPLRIGVFNDYWRRRLRAETLAHPAAWLKLELRKACYLLGNHEQYNNKTYSFHKARSPWLRFNPLGWGVLLLGGTLGLLALGRAQRPLSGAVLVTAGAVATGLLLSYISARFRLPLAALLCVLAGGVTAPQLWWPGGNRGRLVTAVLLPVLGVISFPGWFGAADRSTHVQDHLLLAAAAEKTGDDLITWDEARAALAMQPAHPDALQLGVTSYFNLLLTGAPGRPPEVEWHRLAGQLLAQTTAPTTSRQANLIGLALWRGGDRTGVELWRKRSESDPDALAALVLSGEAAPVELAWFNAIRPDDSAGVFQRLHQARAKGDAPAELKAAVDRLFPAK